ncbi:protein [Escherichia coli]|uniref:Protein n=1 Tax=Escherichia coli TaxID=562 RepID=A0A376KL01_ECOLX|nr:protein [Escherichia coli]
MTTTGLRPRLNVRQRKDTGYLPHSSPFSLQFRPAILYSDGYLPLVPEDKNENGQNPYATHRSAKTGARAI